MNWLKYLFFPQWDLVKAESAMWRVNYSDFGFSVDKRAVYKIYYSPVRRRWKLVCSGYRPHEHKNFPHIVEIYNQLKAEPGKD